MVYLFSLSKSNNILLEVYKQWFEPFLSESETSFLFFLSRKYCHSLSLQMCNHSMSLNPNQNLACALGLEARIGFDHNYSARIKHAFYKNNYYLKQLKSPLLWSSSKPHFIDSNTVNQIFCSILCATRTEFQFGWHFV